MIDSSRGNIGLPLRLPADVVQDSIRPSGARRSGEIHRLAEVPPGAVAIRDADGVQEVGDGMSCGCTWYVGLTDFAGKDGKAFLPSRFA